MDLLVSLAFGPMIEALGYLRANALSYTGIPGLKFDYLERERVEQNVVNRGSQKVIQDSTFALFEGRDLIRGKRGKIWNGNYEGNEDLAILRCGIR